MPSMTDATFPSQWSTKKVFEKCYNPIDIYITNVTMAKALHADLKAALPKGSNIFCKDGTITN